MQTAHHRDLGFHSIRQRCTWKEGLKAKRKSVCPWLHPHVWWGSVCVRDSRSWVVQPLTQFCFLFSIVISHLVDECVWVFGASTFLWAWCYFLYGGFFFFYTRMWKRISKKSRRTLLLAIGSFFIFNLFVLNHHGFVGNGSSVNFEPESIQVSVCR